MDEGSDFHGDEFRDVPAPPRPGRGARQRVHPLTLAAIAVAGATIGIAAVLIADAGAGTTSATGTTPSYAPASPAPTPSGGSYGGGQVALPPLRGTGGGLQMMIGGRVTAVSAVSITIGGAGPSVTAKITKATRFTGTAHGIGGVKVGDQVSAVLSGSSASNLTATTIEDPAAAP
jgi:hypothetical protein